MSIHLEPEDIIGSLWSVIHSDFNSSVILFIDSLFKSSQHKKSLQIFSNYLALTEHNINIGILTQLATIFADEPDHIAEYNQICSKIEKYLDIVSK